MTDAHDTTPDGSKEAPGGYQLDVDHREVLWFKQHEDGRRTLVELELRYADACVTALDIRGRDELAHQDIGSSDEEAAARRKAREWMAENPDGVAA